MLNTQVLTPLSKKKKKKKSSASFGYRQHGKVSSTYKWEKCLINEYKFWSGIMKYRWENNILLVHANLHHTLR